jgi:Arc/MetJ family transcription regulator
MRTTLDLDEELVANALRETGCTTKTELVELGLRELIDKSARQRLRAAAGSIPAFEAPPRRKIG